MLYVIYNKLFDFWSWWDVEYRDEYGGRTALIRAAVFGQEKNVKLLLEKGAKIDAVDWYGRTALVYAAESGHEEIVRLLLERGAEIDAVDGGGWTALMYAARDGREKVVRLLLERGAEIDAVDGGGWTALIRAARDGREKIVRLLLERGAKIDAVNGGGWTALILAAMYGYEKIVRLLLENNANIDLRNKDGKVLDYVRDSEKKKDFVLMLVESLGYGRRRIQPGDGSVMAEYGGFIEAELSYVAQLRARLFLHVIRNVSGLGEMLCHGNDGLKIAYRGASEAAAIGEMGEVCKREARRFERENAYEAIQRHENHGVNSLYGYFMESFEDFEKLKWLKRDLARILGSEKLSAGDVFFALSFVNYDYLNAYEFAINAPKGTSVLGLEEFVDEVKGTAKAAEILKGLEGDHVARLKREPLGGVACWV